MAPKKKEERRDVKYNTGTCEVPNGWIGDEYCDCCDCSDEHVGHPDCLYGWYCENYQTNDHCIPFEWENDLLVDCYDGSDENMHMCQKGMMPEELISDALVQKAPMPFRPNNQRGLWDWINSFCNENFKDQGDGANGTFIIPSFCSLLS